MNISTINHNYLFLGHKIKRLGYSKSIGTIFNNSKDNWFAHIVYVHLGSFDRNQKWWQSFLSSIERIVFGSDYNRHTSCRDLVALCVFRISMCLVKEADLEVGNVSVPKTHAWFLKHFSRGTFLLNNLLFCFWEGRSTVVAVFCFRV